MTEIERIEVIKILRTVTMGIKLASVLITLLIASAVMFAGCIEKDESTKVSEIAASPAAIPIILPTSTPIPTSVLEVA